MSHLVLKTRKGAKIIIHPDALKEAFPTADKYGTVCVISVRKRKGEDTDTFTVVMESTEQIEEQLERIRKEKLCALGARADADTSDG